MNQRVNLWFELLLDCNLSCEFCYQRCARGACRPDSPVSRATAVGALKRILSIVDVRCVAVTGGEPLLHPEFVSIAESLSDWIDDIIVVTNGTLLCDNMIDRLLEVPVRTFQIPLHSARASVHNKLTRVDSWENTTSAIVRLRKKGAHVIITFVATRQNYRDFLGVLEIAHVVGVRTVVLNCFLPACTLPNAARRDLSIVDQSVFEEEIRRATTFAREVGVRVLIGSRPIGSTHLGEWPEKVGADCYDADAKQIVLDGRGNLRQCLLSPSSVGSVFSEDARDLIATLLREDCGDQAGACACCTGQRR